MIIVDLRHLKKQIKMSIFLMNREYLLKAAKALSGKNTEPNITRLVDDSYTLHNLINANSKLPIKEYKVKANLLKNINTFTRATQIQK